jgi:hypothetical protein
MKRFLTGVNIAVVCGLAFVFLLALIFVVVRGSTKAETFVQGFSSETTLQPGIVVSVSKTSNKSVEPAPHDDTGRIYGVVIDPSDAAVTVGNENNKTYVANSGQYEVFVTSENGAIKSGDYISMSATDGIAAKAKGSQPYVLGRALESFNGRDNVLTTSSKGVAIAKIVVDINAAKNPLVSSDIAVPAPLRKVGEAIAGKNVTALRLYSALVVFAITLIVAASLLWIGVRSGMTAIGRNPLSKHSIMKSLVQVLAIDVLIFIIGVFGVYLLLRA